MGWNQIKKNCWNDKHGLSIVWRDIDVFFLCNFEAHTWDWRAECCYLHNNIGSNSLKKPAIIYLYPTASAKCNFQSQILFLFITYQMLNQVNCVNFTFLFIYSFLCFLWLSVGTRSIVKYEVYQTFSAQLFWWASAIHHWQLRAARLHRHKLVSAGKRAMRFWEWFMRSKINDAPWPACKVQRLKGSVAD